MTMLMMNPATLDSIATKAERDLPEGAKLGVFAATDAHGADIEVVVRPQAGKFRAVAAYHHEYEGDPNKRDSFGIKLMYVVGLILACMLSGACAFTIGGHEIVIATPTPAPVPSMGTPSPAPRLTNPPAPTDPATPSPSPVPSYVAPLPQIDMTTSGEPATGEVSITQHYIVRPELLSPQMRDEVPTLDPATPFWRNQFDGRQRARNCDSDHFNFADGSHSPLWWFCGGSEKFHRFPRDFDVARAGQPFKVACTVPFNYPVSKKNPDRDDYYAIKVGAGPGTCTVCVPPGATTIDGVVVPVANRCGTWPIQ